MNEEIYPEVCGKFIGNEYKKLRRKVLFKNYAKSSPNKSTEISIFHIGGRGKLGPSSKFEVLGKHCSYVFFEADEDPTDPSTKVFAKQIKKLRSSGCNTTFKEVCIGGDCSERTFCINTVQTSNSLLPINPKAGRLYMEHGGYWGKHANEVRTVSFDTVTLDHILQKEKMNAANFMVLDVQGAEGEILEGASSILDSDLLGIVLEVEMYPIYKDQPLFGDTFSILNKKGFLFFGFWKQLQVWHPYVQIGKGRTIVGEAVYFKDFEYLVQNMSDPMRLTIQLMKLARLAFCMNYDSYGFEILNYVTQKYPDLVQGLSEVQYIKDQVMMWNKVSEKLKCWPKLKHLGL